MTTEPDMEPAAWVPTHRHHEGGMYRRERPIKIKIGDSLWMDGVEYTDARGQLFGTDLARWRSRFQALSLQPAAPPAQPAAQSAPVAQPEREFRNCEFCGCHTNARQRFCCDMGRDADRERSKARAALARPPAAQPVAQVLFRQDDDGLEPVMFYGPGTAPDPSTLKDRFTLRDVWLSPPAHPPASGELDDIAALVRRLAHALRKAAPDHDLPENALDYLKRKGLDTSPFRSEGTTHG